MANDITTLAIELQSKEAETSLQTFNALLSEGSKNAKAMERLPIGVDIDEAVRQLSLFKDSFDDIAKRAGDIHFDLGVNMPTAFAAPRPEPGADNAALEELKAFFEESREDMREVMGAFKESMEQLSAMADRAGTSIRVSGESMREAGESAGEYAAKLREVNAAQKELDKLDAKSEADAKAAYEADQRAAEAKRALTEAQRELKKVSEQLNATHAGGAGDIMALTEREEELKGEVEQLSEAYKEAQSQADKFGEKLDDSSGKAEEAKARLERLKKEMESMPEPVKKAKKAGDDLQVGFKRAGTAATKFARGFNAIAFAGGAAVPGLSKLGNAISMFAYGDPMIAGAVLGLGAVSAAITKIREASERESKFVQENASRAMQAARAAKEFVSESENDWTRLGELADVGSLTNEQNQEATAIINRLTETYGALGVEIDKTTGKLNGYAAARAKASETDKELQRETLRHAKEMASYNAVNEVKKFYNSTGDAFVRERNQELLASLTNSEMSEVEKQKAINAYKERLQRVMNGQEQMTYQTETYHHTGSSIYSSIDTHTISSAEAAEVLKHVEGLEKAWKDANAAKRELEKFDTKELEEYSKKVEAAQKELFKAQAGLINNDGVLHLETEEEKYQRIEQEWYKIRDAIEEAQLAGKGEDEILKLKTQEASIAKEILTYQEKQSQEEAKRAEAAQKANEAAAEHLKKLQSGYIVNASGGLERKKTTDELASDRTETINDLISRISEIESKGDNQTLDDLKELTGKRLELANLQAEQLKYQEQVKGAETAHENALKEYLFDKNGAVIRKRTEQELQDAREEEIKAARERLAATEEGTLERAQAQADLDRLAIEEYNMRKKSDATAMVQEARAANTRMVHGIEARGTEALALESRIFKKDDSEKSILKDTKEVQQDIKEITQDLLTAVSDLKSSFSNLNDKLQEV